MAKAISSNDSPFEGKKDIIVNDSKLISKPKNGEWRQPFIEAIMQGMSVTDATREIGIDITLPYKRRIDDEEFRNAWKEAAEIGTEFLEQEAARRAYHGTLKPVFHKGVPCGEIREYSDTLLIFLLKARKPEKYREGVEEGGRGNTVLNINVNVIDKPQLSEAQVIEVQAIEQSEGSGEDDKRLSETVTIPTE